MYQLTIAQNPTGLYSFMGSVPRDLFAKRPASRDSLKNGLAFADLSGQYWEWYCPCFDTPETALNYATKLGYSPVVET